MEQNNNNQPMAHKPLDFKNNQPVRWCPGCGDHAVLNVLLKAMAQLNIPPEKTAVISGTHHSWPWRCCGNWFQDR